MRVGCLKVRLVQLGILVDNSRHGLCLREPGCDLGGDGLVPRGHRIGSLVGFRLAGAESVDARRIRLGFGLGRFGLRFGGTIEPRVQVGWEKHLQRFQ